MNPFGKIEKEIGGDLSSQLPKKWKKIGDILVIDFSDLSEGEKKQAAPVYAHFLKVKTIIQKNKVSGELRKPNNIEILFGENTVTEIMEYGIRYKMDLSKTMWSPGNTGWRSILNGPKKVQDFYTFNNPKTIVDFFAGIGYFSIQLAKSYPYANVISIDKNPDSIEYLEENVRMNGIKNIEIINDDCRNVTRLADVIHLGYIGNTLKFLEHAKNCLHEKGIAIFHEAYLNSWLGFKRRTDWEGIPKEFSKIMLEMGFFPNEFERVKFYGPNKSHIIAKLVKV